MRVLENNLKLNFKRSLLSYRWRWRGVWRHRERSCCWPWRAGWGGRWWCPNPRTSWACRRCTRCVASPAARASQPATVASSVTSLGTLSLSRASAPFVLINSPNNQISIIKLILNLYLRYTVLFIISSLMKFNISFALILNGRPL